MKKKGEYRTFSFFLPNLWLLLPTKCLFLNIRAQHLCPCVAHLSSEKILCYDHRLYLSPGQPSCTVFTWQMLKNLEAICVTFLLRVHVFLFVARPCYLSWCVVFPNPMGSESSLWSKSDLVLILALTVTIWLQVSYLTFLCISFLICKVRSMTIMTTESSHEDQMR